MDEPILLDSGKGAECDVGRASYAFAGADVELAPMPRARDDRAVHLTLRKGRACVWATILDREEFPADVIQRDGTDGGVRCTHDESEATGNVSGCEQREPGAPTGPRWRQATLEAGGERAAVGHEITTGALSGEPSVLVGHAEMAGDECFGKAGSPTLDDLGRAELVEVDDNDIDRVGRRFVGSDEHEPGGARDTLETAHHHRISRQHEHVTRGTTSGRWVHPRLEATRWIR